MDRREFAQFVVAGVGAIGAAFHMPALARGTTPFHEFNPRNFYGEWITVTPEVASDPASMLEVRNALVEMARRQVSKEREITIAVSPVKSVQYDDPPAPPVTIQAVCWRYTPDSHLGWSNGWTELERVVL